MVNHPASASVLKPAEKVTAVPPKEGAKNQNVREEHGPEQTKRTGVCLYWGTIKNMV